MLKNIIFDIGGVIIEWGHRPLKKLLGKTDSEINKITRIIYRDERFKSCILGNLSQADYMQQLISENPEYSDDINKILSEEYQEKALPVIKENLEKVFEFKNKGYKIYFLSNITDVSYNYLKNKLKILDLIDGGVYSFKEHTKKPDKKIFDILIKRYNLNKDETIFFDDSVKNVKSGNEYGIKSYVFESIKNIPELGLWYKKLLAIKFITSSF